MIHKKREFWRNLYKEVTRLSSCWFFMFIFDKEAESFHSHLIAGIAPWLSSPQWVYNTTCMYMYVKYNLWYQSDPISYIVPSRYERCSCPFFAYKILHVKAVSKEVALTWYQRIKQHVMSLLMARSLCLWQVKYGLFGQSSVFRLITQGKIWSHPSWIPWELIGKTDC